MKIKIFVLSLFLMVFALEADAQFGGKYKPVFATETLTNTDTLILTLSTNSLRRQFTQSYDVAGIVKRTELTGSDLTYTFVIQDAYDGSTGTDWITRATITPDVTGTSQLISVGSYTTTGDRTRIVIIQGGTGTASFDPQLILFARSGGLY